ncbi:MAG TPA: glycosyltransferase, partial [Streptosporangiaceae bacterium]
AAARGHQVRVLGTEGLRDRFESAGASFRVYRYAPDNDCRSAETDLIKEWEARTPLGQFARVRDRVMFGPAREFCRDVVEELDREPADLVVVDTLIPSALSGADAAGCPSVLLMHGPYLMPRPGAPPPGSGFMPARGRLGRGRDRAAASLLMRVFRTGMPALNQARAELGLAPLRDLGDVLDTVGRVLVCTSASYDFAAGDVPGNVRYVGPQLDDAAGGTGDTDDGTWDDPDGRPLVLVGLSSTVMSHEEELLQRAADALGRLPVRGLVTTGPAVDPAAIRAPANVDVRRWVRHADVLPYCSAVLTHGGHGTVIKALAAGVPLVVAPLGRDQPDNAARVVRAGAGLRVSRKASAADLRNALGRVLDGPGFRAAARRMAATLAAERDEGLVVDELERAAIEGAAIEGTALSHPAPRNPSWR